MVVVAGALAAGCGGGGDGAPEFEGSDEEQVAATVRVVVDAMAAGDGEAACPLLSDQGQEILIRVTSRAGDAEVDSCEEAVAAVGETEFSPGIVDPAPENVILHEDGSAELDCRHRGAFLLNHTEDGWRIGAPYCVD